MSKNSETLCNSDWYFSDRAQLLRPPGPGSCHDPPSEGKEPQLVQTHLLPPQQGWRGCFMSGLDQVWPLTQFYQEFVEVSQNR